MEREYLPADAEGLVWREDGAVLGLATWAVEGERAEIVSLDALEPGRRIGARLMEAAEEELRRRGVRTLRVVTTNDNPRALSFYARRGYRLLRLHLDANGPRAAAEAAGAADRQRRHPPARHVGASKGAVSWRACCRRFLPPLGTPVL